MLKLLRSSPQRYAISVFASVAAVLLTLIIGPIRNQTPFLLAASTLVFISMYGGFGPALAASSLAAASMYFLLHLPPYSLVVFVTMSALIGLVSEKRKEGDALRAGQTSVVEMIASNAPLGEILASLTRFIESQSPGMLCSVLLLDEDGLHVRHGAAPSLPKAYVEAIDGVGIGPSVGSCGTAIYTGMPVIAADILKDPRWDDYRDAAMAHGLRACWSMPIFSSQGKVLGSFAMYYRRPRRPNAAETRLINLATHIAGLAVERKLAEEELLADITRRQQAEEERTHLLASEKAARVEADLARAQAERERVSLNATIEQMADGLIVWDADGVVVRANRQAQSIFGFASEDPIVLIRDIADSRFDDGEGQRVEPDALPVQRALREGRVIESQLWYARPNDERVLLSVIASPFFNEQGKLAGVVALIRDVTEQQRVREQMQQADKLRALGQLSSGVAHNFNNALAAVLGYTELALPMARDADQENYLLVVQKSAKDAARMVKRIQNFSRGRGRAERSIPVRLADIARDAIDITRPRWRNDAEALGIRYEVKLRWEASEELLVHGEASELREVFVNIIFNALDAMPQGGDLSIGALADGVNAQVSFSDTGAGMTEEIRLRVFDPFFTTKGTAGLGMGLSESYRIVERHGGRIEVETQVGRGTTFNVTLPLGPTSEVEAPRETGRAPGRRAQVLVIDDEEAVRNVIAAMLSGQGHMVVKAESAEQALQMPELCKFDIVFTDLAMPNVDGIAAAAAIRAQSPRPKIVLMSGHGADKARARAAELGCIDAAISKPFNMSEVRNIVNELLKE